MRDRVILDLCSGSGAWSLPYRVYDYDVRRIDLPQDVRLLEYPGRVHGILAAPPCTVFARSGFRWPRSELERIDALSVVDACLRLVVVCRPEWWALENPIGNLKNWLGKPAMYFNPCDYGDPYTKRTALWGSFTEPQRRSVAPALGSMTHTLQPGPKRAAIRAITPAGFAAAFFMANP
jgi:hypothetical protein